MDEIKPSEALLVRCLLPHCIRMSSVWLKNTKLLREIHKKSHKSSKQKERSGAKSDSQDGEDILAMVNVLRKIYKEVHSLSVMDLIRCWLKLTDDEQFCVLTRGDSRGRMRRIDGGKGPDKVWRLDTLVGMLYHGLPLTSADSSLIHHSCNHDLCVRPQHLRVRLSSLSVVLVLKALSQSGYSIKKNDRNAKRTDEFVDISGPFSIQKLNVLRNEFVQINGFESYKLASSPDDYFILDQNPSLKKYYMIHSKRPASPASNANVKSSNIFKRQLLFRLIENSKQEKLHSTEFKPQNKKNITTEKSHIYTASSKRKPTSNNGLVTYYSQDSRKSKYAEIIREDVKESQCRRSESTLEGEEKELVEIMEIPATKRKCDWIDSMLVDLSQSPSKSVLERLLKDTIRSSTESDKDFITDKLVTDFKIWQGNKSIDLDDTNLELFDVLSNTMPCSKSEFCSKMTPNIFSPLLDMEEFQAAE